MLGLFRALFQWAQGTTEMIRTVLCPKATTEQNTRPQFQQDRDDKEGEEAAPGFLGIVSFKLFPYGPLTIHPTLAGQLALQNIAKLIKQL